MALDSGMELTDEQREERRRQWGKDKAKQNPDDKTQAEWSGVFEHDCGDFLSFAELITNNLRAGFHSNSVVVEFKKSLIVRLERLVDSRRTLEVKTRELHSEPYEATYGRESE